MPAYTIPGVTLRLLDDNGHAYASPPPAGCDPLDEAGHAFAAAPVIRRGFGTRHTADLTDDQRDALGDYLDTLVDLLRGMTAEERGESGRVEIDACEAGLRALGFITPKEATHV